MSIKKFRPCGDFRVSYSSDMSLFEDKSSLYLTLFGILLLLISPFIFDSYIISLLIYIGFYGIAALGLNILVGFTGQISVGHAVFGFGAFASAWLSNKFFSSMDCYSNCCDYDSICRPDFWNTCCKSKRTISSHRHFSCTVYNGRLFFENYLVYRRSRWSSAEPLKIFNFILIQTRSISMVLFWLIISFIMASNLMRTRDGRAFLAVRDHYLSAEMMGINLSKYRILSFGISSLLA